MKRRAFALAAGARTEAHVLTDLIDDPSVTVRAALALNTASPASVTTDWRTIATNGCAILLARKLAALMPTLSAPDQARLSQETWQTLKALVADETARVRAVIAEAVKELPDAPRDLIRRLAQDTNTSVCEPVIRLSPLLATEDLVALVAMAPGAGTVLAVARRGDLEPSVSDAIAATADVAAIRALLANRSAQIREATLDALVARSVDHPDWHEPLVRRPSLPARAALMLCEIVATHLLAELAVRADLPRALAEELRRRVAARTGAERAGTCRADRHDGRGGIGAGIRLGSARRAGRGNTAGGGAPGRGALFGCIAGSGRRHAGLGGGSRLHRCAAPRGW